MASKKKSKKSTKSKPASKKKAASRKRTPKKTAKTRSRSTAPARRKSNRTQRAAASRTRTISPRSGLQSGDLQGLSDLETADSESVDELLEEGNAFEADAVAGVEHADDEQEREVHTHEVAEDDVPDEYRNQN